MKIRNYTKILFWVTLEGDEIVIYERKPKNNSIEIKFGDSLNSEKLNKLKILNKLS